MQPNEPMAQTESDPRTADGVRGENECLRGGGEMGAFMRSFDWANSPLGPVEHWPPSLRTSVGTCLNSRFAILIWWGPDLIMLYNDAYRQIIGGKHPAAFGHPGQECWPEIWHIIGPMLKGVLERGEATWSSDLLLMLERRGYPEECYFTFSYSSVCDESGQVRGVFTPVAETTERVINERRVATLRDLAACAGASHDIQSACAAVARALSQNSRSIPFASLYLFDARRSIANLAGTAGIEPGAPAARETLPLPDLPAGLSSAVLSTKISVIEGLAGFWGPLPAGAWAAPAESVVVLPVVMPGQDGPIGFVLAGANPHKRVDADYRTFFELVAGHISAVIAAARAYEEERHRAEALAEIDRAKTIFFSNVSHEFRTPLTLLLGPLEETLANRHGILPMGAAGSLSIAHRNALRLLKLVNMLLEFSRIEAKRAQAFREPVDLPALTAGIASNFTSLCQRAGLTFNVECPPFPPGDTAWVDPGMWEKIVLNLLSNAFKFTLRGGIDLRLEIRGGNVVLSVRDTGVGIPPEELPRMFERFHRVEQSRGRTHEGTGIGLALVRELAALHGGTATVESELGKGSEFTVSIPLGTAHTDAPLAQGAGMRRNPPVSEAFVEEAARWLPGDAEGSAFAAGPGAASTDHSPKEARILLADDNADMRLYVTRQLAARYDVESTANGYDALDAARARVPDLIVADIMMPGLDGFGLLRAIRSDPNLSRIPVVLLSARAGEEARIEGLQAGADDYLSKPFSSRELLAVIESHLRLYRLRRENSAALRQADRTKGLLAAIIESSDDAIISKDLDGIITSWNIGAERLFGYSAREAVGRPVTILIPPERLDEEPRILAMLRRGERVDHFETIRIRKDGTRLNISLTISPVRDAQGRIVGASKVARDITEKVRREAALRRANADLEQFAHSASHDLQEPLRTLALYSQLLDREFSGSVGPLGKEWLGHIIEASLRMEALLRNLRIYTQVSTMDKDEPPPEEVDSAAIVRDVIANLDAAIRESGASVRFENLPRVRMPAFQLEQVFQNLIANAVRYRSATAPSVEISAQKRDSDWVFAVRDNGIGIPRDYHGHIFGIFKRLHSRSEYPGTGMGLAICQRCVERAGGRIWVESEPGRGSTFFFTIPA